VPFGSLGWGECLLILLLIAVVAALAFRTGFFRGRGRR
jgi:hypothetical protein